MDNQKLFQEEWKRVWTKALMKAGSEKNRGNTLKKFRKLTAPRIAKKYGMEYYNV